VKPPSWSHSSLADYENCEHKYFRRHVVRDVLKIDTPDLIRGRATHAAIESRLTDQEPLPERYGRLEAFLFPIDAFQGEKHIEWKLGIREDGSPCDFAAEDVWGRGVLDVALVKDQIALLFDWKTGKTREDASELATHAVLLHAHRPQVTRITGHYVWLQESRVGINHDLSDVVVRLAAIRGRYEKIKLNMRNETWHKRQNPLCKWCNVIDCEFRRS
jgi:hypothetical protein